MHRLLAVAILIASPACIPIPSVASGIQGLGSPDGREVWVLWRDPAGREHVLWCSARGIATSSTALAAGPRGCFEIGALDPPARAQSQWAPLGKKKGDEKRYTTRGEAIDE